MLYGTIFMLGAAYALHKGAHIRTDFFYEKWSATHQGMVDSISYIVFFFPSIVMLLGDQRRRGLVRVRHQRDLRADAVAADPVAVQVRWCRSTCVLLLIQGVSEIIKSFYPARTGIVLEHKEKIEI